VIPFAVVLFLSAALIFWLEPLVARQVLPDLGGSPSVWTTCVLFYQLVLLAGYGLAHVLARSLPLRAQVLAWAGLLALALLGLPPDAGVRVSEGVRVETALLGSLALSVGPAFLALGVGAPLLQSWLARAGHADPYVLYAASNGGSLLGLLAYPLLLEPGLGLARQGLAWSLGLGALAVAALPCLAVAWRVGGGREGALAPGAPPPAATRGLWLVLSAVPASLVLGVTAHVSTDLAAVPLLWVVPMALYLLTFALAFAPGDRLPWRGAARWLPLAVVTWMIPWAMEATHPAWLVVGLQLVLLTMAATVCHGRLASLRPPPGRLTEYFLFVGAGGALGGAFNALVAPLVFSSLSELPLAVALACLLVPPRRAEGAAGGRRRGGWPRDLAFGLLPGAAAALLALLPGLPDEGRARRAATIGAPALLCYLLSPHPLRFGLGVSGVLLASLGDESLHGRILARRRSFFGIHRVIRSGPQAAPVNTLRHGTTEHGRQRVETASGAPTAHATPLAYYHRDGPLGDVFARPGGFGEVAVVGLGAGALAAYARPGDRMLFLEIDAEVVDLALDPRFFGYVPAARKRGADVPVVQGDARRSLEERDERFDLLVLDAFGSDAVPVHLLTREALALYRSRLRPGGVLALHVSSRTLDLVPVVAALADALGLAGRVRDDRGVAPGEAERSGRWPSIWVALASSPEELAWLRRAGWRRLAPGDGTPVWSDDHTPILRALRWR